MFNRPTSKVSNYKWNSQSIEAHINTSCFKIQINTFTNTTILLFKLIIALTGITLTLIKKFLLMSSRGVGTRSADILMTLGCQTEFANTYCWKLGIIP